MSLVSYQNSSNPSGAAQVLQTPEAAKKWPFGQAGRLTSSTALHYVYTVGHKTKSNREKKRVNISRISCQFKIEKNTFKKWLSCTFGVAKLHFVQEKAEALLAKLSPPEEKKVADRGW